ncbi:hypothetical protein, partial [Streptomyces sp. NPDC054838]
VPLRRQGNPRKSVPGLHTHGLHVDPTGIAGNIFRTFPPAPAAGRRPAGPPQSIAVPANHPAGTF